MDFHRAFFDIDIDGCGEISRDDLERYMRRMNYQEAFVQKWLNLFDIDHNGTISYTEYCTTLGLLPKKEIIAKASACTSHATPNQNGKKQTKGRKNSQLSHGLMRFSRARVIQKKALYRIKPATLRGSKQTAKKPTKQSTKSKIKEITGANNGDKREVPLVRSPRFYPTQESRRGKTTARKQLFCNHQPHLRKSLQPGSIVILLVGRHRGKRAVFLKQLESGLLLITGPFKFNGCPIRRVHQSYVIGTSTRVDISAEDVPKHLNDVYFERKKASRKRGLGEEGDIFRKEQPKYELSEDRKKDQAEIDKLVISRIGNHKESSALRRYLRTMFGLRRCDKPHEMVF